MVAEASQTKRQQIEKGLHLLWCPQDEHGACLLDMGTGEFCRPYSVPIEPSRTKDRDHQQEGGV